MDIKGKVKGILSEVLYALYRGKILKNRIEVKGVDETLDILLNSQKSMVRFGDGEATMIRGRGNVNQKPNAALTEDLKRIIAFEHENLLVTLPDIFGDLSIYRKASQSFWKDHLMVARKVYYHYCNTDKAYYNTTVSRFYCTLSDKSKCDEWAGKLRNLFKDKELLIVEGQATHNGVGNDLLAEAKSIKRIIGPSHDAYWSIDKIFEKCCEYPKDMLILLSLGAPAKPLAERLFIEGYRVLDIGNMDLEYEWYKMQVTDKTPLKKHSAVSEEDNRAFGYDEYLSQIVCRIE